MITRVFLKPLRKISQLKKLRAYSCVACGYEGNMFTMTFQLDNEDGKEILQDLSLEFSKKGFPKAYISEPYEYGKEI